MTPEEKSILAAKILGLPLHRFQFMLTHEKNSELATFDTLDEAIAERDDKYDGPIKTIPIQFYFHLEANAALQLVEWMRERGFAWQITIATRFAADIRKRGVCHEVCIADTLPLAILGAFLRANGKEVE